VTVAAKSGQFTADETGKDQLIRGNRRNLAGEGVVKKISSSERVASVPNFCMVGASGQGTWVKGSVASVLASESDSSFLGRPA